MNHSSRMFSIYTISLFATLMRRATAAHVLPVFQNLWYDFFDDYDLLGMDGCGADINSYKLSAYSSFATNLPVYSDCDWNYDTPDILYFDSTYPPPGFITGNWNDWTEITTNPNAPLAHEIRWECKKEGDSYDVKRYSVDIAPFYDCPPNSRITFNEETLETTCDTDPPPCIADIVARDLNVTGMEGCGHVGLITSFASYDVDVIEVLKALPGVHLTPLHGENNSFISVSYYWGERYGVGNTTRIDIVSATEIISSGIDQSYYTTFTYANGWKYYPGGTEEHPNDCKFRCDSFVYWCYLINGFKIQESFSAPDSPKTLFNNFLCSADPVGNCPTHEKMQVATTATLSDDHTTPSICMIIEAPDIMQTKTTTVEKIFQELRPALANKQKQREQLTIMVKRIQNHHNVSYQELFVRCLCFELKNMNPEALDSEIKPLLAGLLWQHKYLTQDNFLLAIMEKNLRFYINHPSCRWLNAFSTVKAETQVEKEESMISYIDNQKDAVEKANFISGSGSTLLKIVPIQKKCEYGKFFQHAYNYNNSLSNREKKIVWSALATLGVYSPKKDTLPNKLCRDFTKNN